jgi:hypothetical protein
MAPLDHNLEGAKPTMTVLQRNLSDPQITDDNKNWYSGRFPYWHPPGEFQIYSITRF